MKLLISLFIVVLLSCQMVDEIPAQDIPEIQESELNPPEFSGRIDTMLVPGYTDIWWVFQNEPVDVFVYHFYTGWSGIMTFPCVVEGRLRGATSQGWICILNDKGICEETIYFNEKNE